MCFGTWRDSNICQVEGPTRRKISTWTSSHFSLRNICWGESFDMKLVSERSVIASELAPGGIGSSEMEYVKAFPQGSSGKFSRLKTAIT